MLAEISQQLLGLWNDQIATQLGLFIWQTVLALLALIAVWVSASITHGAIRRALSRTRAHPNARVLLDRVSQFFFLLLAAAWVLSIFGVQLTALLAVLGAGALAVSLALQDVLKNLVAGLYILVERPFAIGDQIEFKTFSGAVETIELRTTALRTPAGQRVIIPNAMIFAETIVNRSAYGRQLLRIRIVLPADGATRESTDEVVAALEAALPDAPAPAPASTHAGLVAPLFNSSGSSDALASSGVGTPVVTIEIDDRRQGDNSSRDSGSQCAGRSAGCDLGAPRETPAGRANDPGLTVPEATSPTQSQSTRRRIGILGGSFDPIHHAHLISAEVAAAAYALDQVVLVPALQSPLKAGPRAAAPDRLEMVRLAIQNNPLLDVTSVEFDRPPPSYMVDTMAIFRDRYPDSDLYLLLGADALQYLLEWRQPERLLDLCQLIVLSRPGYALEVPQTVREKLGNRSERIALQAMPNLEISSTDLRRRFSAGEPVRYLLPDAVERYVRKRALYGAQPASTNV